MAEQFDQLLYRLRSPCGIGAPSDHDTMEEAANEIERLAGMLTEAHDKWEACLNEIDKLRAALAPLNLVKRLR